MYRFGKDTVFNLNITKICAFLAVPQNVVLLAVHKNVSQIVRQNFRQMIKCQFIKVPLAMVHGTSEVKYKIVVVLPVSHVV